ncbi:MAG: hypothetical protein KBT21_03665 [Treponema sp.]|nr:hypothetical protein [Candidatus Treponema merdequi]
MKKIIFILLAVSTLFFSCKNDKDEIDIHQNDMLALNPNVQWAVVIEPYAAFRTEASWNAGTNDHSRLGDVLMIQGNAILESSNESSSKEIWYRFDKGWLSESSVSVYQNKYKAQSASKEITK